MIFTRANNSFSHKRFEDIVPESSIVDIGKSRKNWKFSFFHFYESGVGSLPKNEHLLIPDDNFTNKYIRVYEEQGGDA